MDQSSMIHKWKWSLLSARKEHSGTVMLQYDRHWTHCSVCSDRTEYPGVRSTFIHQTDRPPPLLQFNTQRISEFTLPVMLQVELTKQSKWSPKGQKWEVKRTIGLNTDWIISNGYKQWDINNVYEDFLISDNFWIITHAPGHIDPGPSLLLLTNEHNRRVKHCIIGEPQ